MSNKNVNDLGLKGGRSLLTVFFLLVLCTALALLLIGMSLEDRFFTNLNLIKKRE